MFIFIIKTFGHRSTNRRITEALVKMTVPLKKHSKKQKHFIPLTSFSSLFWFTAFPAPGSCVQGPRKKSSDKPSVIIGRQWISTARRNTNRQPYPLNYYQKKKRFRCQRQRAMPVAAMEHYIFSAQPAVISNQCQNDMKKAFPSVELATDQQQQQSTSVGRGR